MPMNFPADLGNLAGLPGLPGLPGYFPSPARGVWYLGPVPIRAYALCIIVGIVAALLIGDRRWQARGGERGVIYDIALWAVPFGLIGGRLYHLMTDWRTYFGSGGIGLQATMRIWDGGLGIWGAVALGGVGAWIGCRRRRIPLPAFGDAIAPAIVLAQAIGRIGNYFNQELYGRETALPWGLEIFWRHDAAGLRDPHLLDGVSTGELYKVVQPTFLYELVWNLVVFVLLIWADRRFRMGHGRLFALYVAGYCVGRFFIELLRDDAATHVAGIRINSFTSTLVFIGAVVYFVLATKGREDPEVLRKSWQPPEAGEGDSESAVPQPEKELVAVAAGSNVSIAGGPAADADDAADGDGAADGETTETEPVDPGQTGPVAVGTEGEDIDEDRPEPTGEPPGEPATSGDDGEHEPEDLEDPADPERSEDSEDSEDAAEPEVDADHAEPADATPEPAETQEADAAEPPAELAESETDET